MTAEHGNDNDDEQQADHCRYYSCASHGVTGARAEEGAGAKRHDDGEKDGCEAEFVHVAICDAVKEVVHAFAQIACGHDRYDSLSAKRFEGLVLHGCNEAYDRVCEGVPLCPGGHDTRYTETYDFCREDAAAYESEASAVEYLFDELGADESHRKRANGNEIKEVLVVGVVGERNAQLHDIARLSVRKDAASLDIRVRIEEATHHREQIGDAHPLGRDERGLVGRARFHLRASFRLTARYAKGSSRLRALYANVVLC